MIKLLHSYGANIDAKDFLGRTPIYLAAKNNHADAVKILLGLEANPFAKCIKKLSAEDVTEDEALKAALKKSKMFMITQSWATG